MENDEEIVGWAGTQKPVNGTKYGVVLNGGKIGQSYMSPFSLDGLRISGFSRCCLVMITLH